MPSGAELHGSAQAAETYDGVSVHELARLGGAPRLIAFDEISSTLDAAHGLAAEGAVSGTVIVATAQTAGRGRHGRSWRSEPGAGVWLTVIHRPANGDVMDAERLDALPLRIGIGLAPVLDAFAGGSIQLKWPNDLYLNGRKLCGVLAEARWRGTSLDWIAIGVGVNVRAPMGEDAAGLRSGTRRADVLAAVVPAIRQATSRTGALSPEEIAVFRARDLAAGRRCLEPVQGEVQGIDPSGALLVKVGSGLTAVRAGSLVLAASDA